MRVRATVAILTLAAMTGLAGPRTLAQEPRSEAERLMGEGLDKMFEALDLLLRTVPQYAAPEMLPNGDIIIRRLPGEGGRDEEEKETPQPRPVPEGDSTET